MSKGLVAIMCVRSSIYVKHNNVVVCVILCRGRNLLCNYDDYYYYYDDYDDYYYYYWRIYLIRYLNFT